MKRAASQSQLTAATADAWLDILWQLMPKGWAWNRDPKSDQSLLLASLANALADVDADCDAVALEVLPSQAFLMLDEYETYLGLPECEAGIQSTVETRRNAIVTKDKLSGGLATWQIEQLASDLGFNITVTEHFPHHCLRNCMYPLYEQKWRHMLMITVNDIPDVHMTCLDNVLTPLISNDARILECTLGKYKMAGKYYLYDYQGGA